MMHQVYDRSSGAILWAFSGPNPQDQVTMDRGIIDGDADQSLQYVDVSQLPHRIVNKSAMAAVLQGAQDAAITVPADGAAIARIIDIPVGTMIRVIGPINRTDVVADGDYELTFDYPGDYVIHLTHPTRLPQEFAIHAT